MLYFNVERWQDCISALNDNFDTVGVNWNTAYRNHHYSGNFWWAKSSYIKKLPKFIRPKLIDFKPQFDFDHNECRLDAEFWIGMKDPKVKCLHYSTVNHYHERYIKERYASL